jgi:hypothetical protein
VSFSACWPEFDFTSQDGSPLHSASVTALISTPNPTVARSTAWPRATAQQYADEWIASARSECLDRMLITGERHLRLVLSEYADHYNTHRPHRALQQAPPAGRPHPLTPAADVRVLRRDRLGGLIHEYSQVV